MPASMNAMSHPSRGLMKEIQVTSRAAMVALLHVRPPSMVRKISEVADPFGLIRETQTIREEKTVIPPMLICCPEELSGVMLFQRIPPSVVRNRVLTPEGYSIETPQPFSAPTMWIVSRADVAPTGICPCNGR